MGKLNYSDFVFIQNALTFYRIYETRNMKEHPDIYPAERVEAFRESIQSVIDNVSELMKGE